MRGGGITGIGMTGVNRAMSACFFLIKPACSLAMAAAVEPSTPTPAVMGGHGVCSSRWRYGRNGVGGNPKRRHHKTVFGVVVMDEDGQF